MSHLSYLDISIDPQYLDHLSCIANAVDITDPKYNCSDKSEDTNKNVSKRKLSVESFDLSYSELDISYPNLYPNKKPIYVVKSQNKSSKITQTVVHSSPKKNKIVSPKFDLNLSYLDVEQSFTNISIEDFTSSDLSLKLPATCTNMSDLLGMQCTPKAEITKKMVSHCVRFNQSYKALESMAKIVNSTSKTDVPDTTYKIKKMIDPLITPEFYIQCNLCKIYTATTTAHTNCSSCFQSLKRVNSKYFVNLPMKAQLIKAINDHLEIILEYDKKVTSTDLIRDVHNGIQYKRVKQKYSDFILLPLTVNTDGARIFRSSKKSVWPIQFYLNFLPPNIRFIPNNILVAAIHEGKPDMREFFKPLLVEFKKIHREGGIIIEKDGNTYSFLPFICQCSADLPAKADIQAMTTHNGYNACGYCFHPGTAIRGRKNDKAVVRYTRINGIVKTRTHQDFLNVYRKIKSTTVRAQNSDGIKNISCLIAADEFDLVNGFGI